MANGYWKLNIENLDSDGELELSDSSKEHIASLIKYGYIEGEIVQE